MRYSIEKLMNINLIEEKIKELENKIHILYKKDFKLGELGNNCVINIQDKKTNILFDYKYVGKIKGKLVDYDNDQYRYKITKKLFKNIEKERTKIYKKANKLNKKIDKLQEKKKLFEEK